MQQLADESYEEREKERSKQAEKDTWRLQRKMSQAEKDELEKVEQAARGRPTAGDCIKVWIGQHKGRYGDVVRDTRHGKKPFQIRFADTASLEWFEQKAVGKAMHEEMYAWPDYRPKKDDFVQVTLGEHAERCGEVESVREIDHEKPFNVRFFDLGRDEVPKCWLRRTEFRVLTREQVGIHRYARWSAMKREERISGDAGGQARGDLEA